MTPPRRVTAADVARSLGLSRATVGFVLNDTPGQTISAATRERVLAEARRLGYRANPAARALASGRSRIILLVLPDWPLDFTLRRNIEEASLALDEAGYALITYTPHPTGHARPLWETLQPDVVISILPLSPERLAEIHGAGVPHVVPDPETVTIEEYPEQGPGLQLRHLAGLGHRRVAFAGSTDPRIADLVQSRRFHAAEAARELGIELVSSIDLGDDEEQLAETVGGWRSAGVTAVAAYNDQVATAVVGTALRLGIRIPAELTVIGHDDTPLASLMQPRLSTVRLDTVGLGRYLADLALSLVEGTDPPDGEPIRHIEIIERDTTGRVG
ncbi:MAG: LacI family transcriptional regulator [Leifsonia xyli]|nr:MAG: LacI family transcriptional regulator [Leifsonia xyli]